MIHKLHIKNMVCPRCITTVRNIFDELNIETTSVQLGEISTSVEISEVQKLQLEEHLLKNGFELLKDNKSRLIEQIKTILVNQIINKII